MLDGVRGLFASLFSGPETLFPPDRAHARLHFVDAGRGFAALAVLFFHYQTFFTPIGADSPPPMKLVVPQEPLHRWLGVLYVHGFQAVPIFWMISGFVFAIAYYGGVATTREFAANRFARLYPLHFLTLCLVAILQAVAVWRLGWPLMFSRNNDAFHFVLQLLFASNWGLGLERGYSYNFPIWSVSVEVLIYGVFWLTRRHLARFGILLPVLVALSGIVGYTLFHELAIMRCLFFFFFGVTLAMLAGAWAQRRVWQVATAALLAIVGTAGLLRGSGPVVNWIGIPGLFGGLLLVLVMMEPLAGRRLRGALGAMGDNSYGMYLLHFPIQLSLFLLLGRSFDLAQLARSSWFLLLFLALTIVFARIGYVAFELPMRRRLRRLGKVRTRADTATIAGP